jgi:hypothetical protein
MIKVGITHYYHLSAQLTLDQVKSVALGVFMAVSREFESMQGNAFWSIFIDSGFSAEDLVSKQKTEHDAEQRKGERFKRRESVLRQNTHKSFIHAAQLGLSACSGTVTLIRLKRFSTA